MGFFDMLAGKAANQLGNAAKQAVNKAVTNSSNKTEKIVFSGDLGNEENPIIREPENVIDTDLKM